MFDNVKNVAGADTDASSNNSNSSKFRPMELMGADYLAKFCAKFGTKMTGRTSPRVHADGSTTITQQIVFGYTVKTKHDIELEKFALIDISAKASNNGETPAEEIIKNIDKYFLCQEEGYDIEDDCFLGLHVVSLAEAEDNAKKTKK